MRFLLTSLLAVLLVNTILAEEFKREKLTLGKAKCTCTLNLESNGNMCSGKGGCDKKCSGSGTVELGIFSFTLSVKKGKAKISKCSADEEETTTEGLGSGEQPVTILPPGSGSGPNPPTGSGSGPNPPTGSGPNPPTGGSGSGPTPPMGEGMKCSCKCDCPDGSGECACDCNCPMQSTAMNCASGFTKVCPMTGDMCPMDMEKVCPMTAQSRMENGNADGYGKGCQCVPDFLMALVHKAMPPADTRLAATNREKVQASIKVGRKECKCSFDINEQDGSCMKSKGSCDKKCSGVATGVELMEGMYVLDMKVKKGKVTITKCEVDTPETGTGSGTGSETGSGTIPGTGSGEGGMEGTGSRCACVGKGGQGSGPNPPTGSGPITIPPTGSGSGPVTIPPTGSGSGPITIPPPGSGSEVPTGSGSGNSSCPRERPDFQSSCTGQEGLSCEYGTQTCCGETSPEMMMECHKEGEKGLWQGYFVDTICMLGGSCPPGPTKPTPPVSCICTEQYSPVCGVDGKTYSNTCYAACEGGGGVGVAVSCAGECPCKDCICPEVYSPVCGSDGQTYSNACKANCAGVEVAAQGECA